MHREGGIMYSASRGNTSTEGNVYTEKAQGETRVAKQ